MLYTILELQISAQKDYEIVGSRRRLKIYFKKTQNLEPAWGLRANLDNFFW